MGVGVVASVDGFIGGWRGGGLWIRTELISGIFW